MRNFGHGQVGTREQPFTNLLPLRETLYPTHTLTELAKSIKALVDTVKDGSDPEENLWVPAGYTYFGQFIDHDLTFDNTSSLNPADAGIASRIPSNLRTPRFDLDSLYGDGPDAHPFMYARDGASLIFKDSYENQTQTSYVQAHQDLFRSPNERAIIGDKRNDENSIICQIHLTFVKYHNAVVEKLREEDPTLAGTLLFERARNEVRWTYQKLVIEDFLPRIVKAEVLEDLQESVTKEEREDSYALYTKDKRSNLPREFVAAAYRFGHSGVRFGYRLNDTTRRSIFPATEPDLGSDNDSLLGFEPLPENHVINNWSRFFPSTGPLDLPVDLGPAPKIDNKDKDIPNPAVRLQFAYKIDTSLVDPLTILPPSVLPTSDNPGGALLEVKETIAPDKLPDPNRPSLALLNLLRGNNYKIQSGQAIAKVLQDNGFPVKSLEPKYLVTRNNVVDSTTQMPINGTFQFNPISKIDSTLLHDTPLWFYVLAEAQASIVDTVKLEKNGTFKDDELLRPEVAKTQLGWVGGRIVAEVFYGLIDSDNESFVNAAPPDWKPILGGNQDVIFANLLKFAGQPVLPIVKEPSTED